jgi:Icc-related predicted phosphoesterase
MRIFAVSDLHVDFDANARWVTDLSLADYRDDVLIVAGDISDALTRLDECLRQLTSRFKHVLYTPGNHDLWVLRDSTVANSLEKLHAVCGVAENCGASMQPFSYGKLSIVPLWSWYDFSFGPMNDKLQDTWADFRACRWPQNWGVDDIAAHFFSMNRPYVCEPGHRVLSFSHFLPRIDVMPTLVPQAFRYLYPVLGSTRLDSLIKQLGSWLHVYGHSHVNRQVELDGTLYVNNALAYPSEGRIAARKLVCVHEEP